MADNFLSPEEVDALLDGVEENKGQTPLLSDVRDYNLAKQERIVRGKMPVFDSIHERFVRLLRIELYDLLNGIIEVAMTPPSTVKYGNFVEKIIPGSSVGLIGTDALRGSALLIMEPALVNLSVDRLFGGEGRVENIASERNFSVTEQRIIQRLSDVLLATYNKSWAQVYQAVFKTIRVDKDISTARIALTNEVVVVVAFEITIGEASGNFHICLPYAMIEPIIDLLTNSPLGSVSLGDKRWIKLMKQQVQSAKLELVADLATTEMTLKEVLNMKVGDVIPLKIEDFIEGKIDGIPVMQCKYGMFDGQYALKVEKLLRLNAAEYDKGETHGD